MVIQGQQEMTVQQALLEMTVQQVQQVLLELTEIPGLQAQLDHQE